MATENVYIKINSETRDITKLKKELKGISTVSDKNAKDFEKSQEKMRRNLKDTGNDVNGFGKIVGNLGGLIAGAFAVSQIVDFGREVLRVRGEFQKLEAVLTNTLGSNSKAQSALAQIQDFAARTPFSVVELTQSFVKLVNQGFKPTMEQMTALGDLASSTGKTFDMLAEAVIDAQVGEFERLKEFGVRAKQSGDQVTFTFKGVETTVLKTDTAIQGYILSLGQLEGVTGSMASISETLVGQVSNLSDSWDTFLNTIGKKSEGAYSFAIGELSKMLRVITEIMETDEEMNERLTKSFAQRQAAQALAEGEKQGIDKRRVATEEYNEAVRGLLAMQKKLTEEEAKLTDRQRGLIETGSQADPNQGIKNKITLYQELILVYDDVLDSIEKLDKPTRSSSDRTIGDIRQEIKDLNAEIPTLKSGSQQLAIALKMLEDKQLELRNAMNPVTREANKQAIEMQKLGGTIQVTGKEINTTLETLTDDQLETRYKQLLGLEIDGKSPTELLEIAHAEWLEEQKFVRESVINSAQTVADTGFEIYKNRLDAEFEYEKSINQAKLQSGEITQSKFEANQKKLFKEQAERNKRLAQFEIAVNGAIASAKVWSTPGISYPQALILQGVVIAETIAAQAVVASQPVPQFAKGVVNLQGAGTKTSDSIDAKLSKGESVITADGTAEDMGLFKAANAGKLQDYIYKNYVYPEIVKTTLEQKRMSSLADNMAKSISNYALDDGRIVGWLGQIDKTSKKNTKALLNAFVNQRKDIRNV